MGRVSARRAPALSRTVLLAAVSTVVALGLAEGVTRVFSLAPALGRIVLDDPTSPLQVSGSPVQGYELKPSFTSPADPSLRINSSGLRGPERAIPKPRGVRRIALAGDSVVEGVGLKREQDTMPSQLEELLRPDGPIEVINAGIVGYNTQAEIELLRRRVVPYQIDLAIVVFVRNDHHSLTRDAGDTWVHPRPRAAEVLFAHSDLFRLAALRLNLFHFREDLDPDYLDARIGRAQARDNVALGLEELARLSTEHGFRAIVVVWPNFGDTINDPPGLFEPGSDRMRVETLGARHGIPVIRLGRAFTADYAGRGSAKPSPRDLYTFEGMHPRPEGNRVAAAILGRLIHERRLLDPVR
jgi:lysophospholipase L1-like esterase